MRITKRQLRRIIKEELSRVMYENTEPPEGWDERSDYQKTINPHADDPYRQSHVEPRPDGLKTPKLSSGIVDGVHWSTNERPLEFGADAHNDEFQQALKVIGKKIRYSKLEAIGDGIQSGTRKPLKIYDVWYSPYSSSFKDIGPAGGMTFTELEAALMAKGQKK